MASWICPTGFTLPNSGVDRLIYVLAWRLEGVWFRGVFGTFGLFVLI